MLRELQAIGWSLLDPQPVSIHGPVSVLIGQNGSCKSSFMDGAKALLGARRFGSNRSPASYRYTGRAGQPAVGKAYLLGRFTHNGQLSCAREFTVVMESGPNRRYFLILDGDQLLRDRSSLNADLDKIKSLPRAKWLSPAQYQQRILEPLGFGPAMRRFLELPQGELSRVLDRDNSKLVELMLELSGGRDASEGLQRAEVALGQAQQAQANAERRFQRSQIKLAEQRLGQQEAIEAEKTRRHLAGIRSEAERWLAIEPNQVSISSAVLSPQRADRLGLELIAGYWTVPAGCEQRLANKLGPGERLPGVNAEGWISGPPLAAIPETSEPGLSSAQRRVLTELVAEIDRAGISAAASELELSSVDELLGAARAFSSSGIPDQPDLVDLSELERALESDRSELERREEILATSRSELRRAEELYSRAAELSLQNSALRFAELCDKAGMAARMTIRSKVGGIDVDIEVSEERGGELRSLTGARNSLSGGWKATVIVFALLSCLGSDQAPPMLLIDEVGASLDEERLGILGESFRRLGEEEGCLTMLTIPSKTMSQTVSAFASQQIAFFRPLAEEPLAPPPHIVEERAQMKAA
jgi:hypothetical protein